MPPIRCFKTAVQLVRFRRAQREFDHMAIGLRLAMPAAVQPRNSLMCPDRPIRLLSFDAAHGAAAARAGSA
jgi:hypothetical protein